MYANNTKIYMETQQSQNAQSHVEKEEQSWMHHDPSFQTIL